MNTTKRIGEGEPDSQVYCDGEATFAYADRPSSDSIIAAQAATIAELQATVKSLATERHDITVQHEFGDYYGVCSCGAMSYPMISAGYAVDWRCPRAVAEAKVAFDRARYEDRKRSMGER